MKQKRALNIIGVGILLVGAFYTSKWGFGSSRQFHNLRTEKILVPALKYHVTKLSDEIPKISKSSTLRLQASADYIKEQFKKAGYVPETQKYSIEGNEFENIFGIKKGITSKLLIIGAHYDTYLNPGADDNMSGVAVMLETAKAAVKMETNDTIVFAAFANEEPPNFKTANMGSFIYTKSLKEKQAEVTGAIILECVGYYSDKRFSQTYPSLFGFFYPNKGDFLALVSDFGSKKLTSRVYKSFQGSTSLPIAKAITFSFVPGVDFSDNWGFWKFGYPALLLTDTAFYRNPNYHQQTDTFDKLDYQKMAEIVKALTFMLIKDTPAPLQK